MRITTHRKACKAIWNNTIIAESDHTLSADGYTYFPQGSIKKEYFVSSEKHSYCPWKGIANYYDIVVDGKVNPGGAWYYPEPYPKAEELKNFIGFWKGVEVVDA